MKWNLLILALYSSFWGFLGWGISGGIIELMLTLSLFLASILIVIFNLKNQILRENMMIFYLPSMIIFAIIKNYDTMSSWKVTAIIIAALLQAFLLFLYYRWKKKRAN